MISLYLGLLLLLISSILFIIAGRQRHSAGLPVGRVVYTDTRSWGAVEKPHYDAALAITGKPDYLVAQGEIFIPVEVKTGHTPGNPYDSHVFQVAVYCLLVEKNFGKRPPYGIIHYPNRDFIVDYTSELESSLLNLIADIRLDERHSRVNRSHSDSHRCRACGYRQVCDQKLA